MKIILSIILMFLSAQSFSGELDGKGLDCDVKELDGQVYWFNNDTVTQVSVRYDKNTGIVVHPESEFIDTTEYHPLFLEIYESNIEINVQLFPPEKVFVAIVNRKTLEITINLYNSGKSSTIFFVRIIRSLEVV